MIAIDKWIPFPYPARQKYPWEEMKVGDSFVSDGKSKAAASYANARHHPKRFQAREIEDGRWRVWRTE